MLQPQEMHNSTTIAQLVWSATYGIARKTHAERGSTPVCVLGALVEVIILLHKLLKL